MWYKSYSSRDQRQETPEVRSVNPVYGTYEVHADPVAEVVDTNTYYSHKDDKEATKVKDNNSYYSK